MADWAEYFWYSYRSLVQGKVRSVLTILGIVIGVAAIVALISLSQGLYASINTSISAFGSQNAIVIPGSLESQMSGGPSSSPSSGRLFEKDIDIINGIAGVEKITGYIYNSQSVVFKDQDVKISIMGVHPDDYFGMYPDFYKLRDGRFPRDSDRNVALVGANIADEVFDNKISTGQFIFVGKDKKKFRVIGVLEKKGGFEGEDNDNAIVAHFDDVRELSKGKLAKNEINGIVFQVSEAYNVSEIAEVAKSKLASSHHFREDEADFSIQTADSILKNIGTIMDILSLFLGFIASISLVVGGVGVMNTMYMSVMERTREIGTLKAIGASDNSVLALFVIESGLLGMVGGVIGIIIAAFIALIVNLFGFQAVVDLPLVLFALAFSFSIGVISGILPARQASMLPPIEALRYE